MAGLAGHESTDAIVPSTKTVLWRHLQAILWQGTTHGNGGEENKRGRGARTPPLAPRGERKQERACDDVVVDKKKMKS